MLNNFLFLYTQFLVLMWPDAGPSWRRNWSQLNKYIHKRVLVVIGAFLDLCDWYSNGDFPY